jgi:hypothetical protein
MMSYNSSESLIRVKTVKQFTINHALTGRFSETDILFTLQNERKKYNVFPKKLHKNQEGQAGYFEICRAL